MIALPVADVAILGMKAALIVATAMLLARLLARRSAAARHIVWAGALAVLILLPAAVPLAPAVSLRLLPGQEDAHTRSRTHTSGDISGARSAASAVAAPDTEPHSRAMAVEPPIEAQTSRARDGGGVDAAVGPWPRATIESAVSGTWLAGVVVFMFRFVAAVAAAQRLVRTSVVVDRAAWSRALAEAARQLGLVRTPPLVASPHVNVPVTTGIIDPTVVIPLEALDWPAERIRVVLLHELAHVRRRDALMQCLQHTACAAHWWNPLVWHAARRLAVERERACDDLVLDAGTPGPDYAAHLVDIARQALGSRPLAAAALAMARPSELEGRVMAMLDSGRPRGRVTPRMLAAAAAGVIVTAGVMASVRLEPRLSAAVLPMSVTAGQPTEAGPALALGSAVQEPQPQSQPQSQPQPQPPASTPPGRERLAREVGKPVDGIPGGVKGGVQGGVPAVASQRKAGEGDEISEATRESVMAALMTALGDKNPDVRKQALFALSRSPSPKLVDPMLKALGDSDPDVRQQAAFALGQVGDPRAVPALATALKDAEADVRARAAFALGQIGSDAAIPQLTAALSDTEPDVRAQVVFALGQIGSSKSIDALKTALSDADDDVRAQAASALGHMLRR